MKRNLLIIVSICFTLALGSCKKVTDFLDKPPGIDVNENTVFSSRVECEKYVASLYQLGMPTIFPVRPAEMGFGGNQMAGTGSVNGITSLLSGITDESETSESFAAPQDWNAGNVTPSNILAKEDIRYFWRWEAIRIANILLERVDEVPNADQAYKDMVKGEALFIRALCNFDMLKRYGGFPLVRSRIVAFEESKIPRSTLEACVNAIVQDCKDAVSKLPLTQPASFTGRAHQGAALALKARTLLYAASPLFNTATPPVSFGNAEDDKLICYGNFDNNRWALAADAAKEVLDWAAGAGYSLVDVTTNRAPAVVAGQKVTGNYRTAWEQHDNPEIILASKGWGAAKGNWQFPWQHLLPRKNYVTNGGGDWSPSSPTFNFVRKYEKRDGTPQTWNMAGGNDLLQKYNELDPRFAQTVVYVGARLNSSVTRTQIWEGAPSNKSTAKGGHWLLKFLPDNIMSASQVPHVPIFRINEVMLSRAEALNEANGGPTPEAYDEVNKIRNRSGMPNLPANLSKEQFRARVQNERDIELAFEEHRLYDIRRWRQAEEDGVMAGSFYGLEINKLNDAAPFPTAFSYKPFVFETRTFPRRLYYFPYPNNEVLKGTLKQNPEW